MTKIFTVTWNFLSNLVVNAYEIAADSVGWVVDMGLIFHVDFPRLEGLLIGVLFAWVLVHREKNPVFRILAAPMKIVLDILDIIWHETLESVVDVYGMFVAWVSKTYAAAKASIVLVYRRALDKLVAVKNKLEKKVDAEQDKE